MTERLKSRLNEYYDLDMDKHGHSYQGKMVKRMAMNLGERQEKAAREFQLPRPDGKVKDKRKKMSLDEEQA